MHSPQSNLLIRAYIDSRRFLHDRPRFTDTLDAIKFLCKDLWMLIFRKQIDNLKTNHRVCTAHLLSIKNFLWKALMNPIEGRLCVDRPWLQTVLTNEYGFFHRCGLKGPAGVFPNAFWAC